MKEVSRGISPKKHSMIQSKPKSLVDRWAETGLGKVSLNIENYYCVPFQKKNHLWLIQELQLGKWNMKSFQTWYI